MGLWFTFVNLNRALLRRFTFVNLMCPANWRPISGFIRAPGQKPLCQNRLYSISGRSPAASAHLVSSLFTSLVSIPAKSLGIEQRSIDFFPDLFRRHDDRHRTKWWP